MKDYVLEKIDPNARRAKLTAFGVLRKVFRFCAGGAGVAFLAGAIGVVATTAGLIAAGSAAEAFFAFGLLGHAWGRKPEEFWWAGAFAGAAAGLLRGIVRGGLDAVAFAIFHGRTDFLSRAAIYLTWAAVFFLGRRSAQYKRPLAGAVALGGWAIGARLAAPAAAFLRTQSDVLQLLADPIASALQAAVAGLLLALAVVFLCEEPGAPKSGPRY